jgi:hypothetical protein
MSQSLAQRIAAQDPYGRPVDGLRFCRFCGTPDDLSHDATCIWVAACTELRVVALEQEVQRMKHYDTYTGKPLRTSGDE